MITRYLYQNPRIVWLIVATILVAGAACLYVMPRLEDPLLKRRVAVITTVLYGADPVEIESSVTVPIEGWLNQVPEIKQVRSNTRANISNIVIELEDRINEPESVWATIKELLSDQASQLPEGCENPQLKIFPLKAYASILAVIPRSSAEFEPFVQRRIAKSLRHQILQLSETEGVDLFNDPGEELAVNVSLEKLAALKLSIADVARQISESKSIPAGVADKSGSRIAVDLDEPNSLERQIESTFIRAPTSSEPIQLSEFAVVDKRTLVPKMTETMIDGKSAIVLGVMVDDASRVDRWATKLAEIVDDFKLQFEDDFAIKSLFSQSEQIEQRMTGLLKNLAISTGAVALIVFLLMGWRCMIVVSVSLPLAACLVICGLRLLSIPIHQMSVTGLIVALGLLIDNAIVMVEEVRARIFRGNSPLSSMTDAVCHLRLPLFGSTLTTVLAFLPIATMPGPSGEFVGSIAVSVILAISASFLLSITVLPPLVYLLGVNSQRQGFFSYGLRSGWIESLYRSSLRMTYRWPVFGILIGGILPAIGFYTSQFLNSEFFPASDRSQIQIELELPASSTVDSVKEAVARVERIVSLDNRVLQQHWFMGQSAPTFYYNVVPRRLNSPSYAQAFVDIQPDCSIGALVNSLQRTVDAKMLDARVIVRKLEQGPPFDAPIELRVIGNDLAQLERIGTELRLMLATRNDVTHTRSDLGDTIPKFTLSTEDALMRESGLTPNMVSKLIYSHLEGASAGVFFEDGDPVPVHVRCDFGDRSVIDSLASIAMTNPKSANAQIRSNPPGVPNARRQSGGPESMLLGSLGEFQLKSGVGAIVRIDGERVNEVKAYLPAGVRPSVVNDELKQWLETSNLELPNNFRIEFGGESEKRSQALSTLIANSVLLFVILLLTLVTVMGSFRSAFLIAVVGGLAVGLGPLALYCFEFPFGFMAIVGTMGLVGIAINDSIVVLAAIRANAVERNEEASQLSESNEVNGQPRKDLVDVVCGCTRHVLTTTFTTMIGFLPLVINGGRFWPPLAIVIAAGVAGATLIALYFVPSVHLILHWRTSEEP